MKYCPNLQCPHRLRVRSPAEFLDHVASCSDCRTPLVDSEDVAVQGLEPLAGAGPYRAGAPRAPARAAPAGRSKVNDTVLGVALIGGGLLLSLFTYMFASRSGGTYVVAWGPIVYGLYRIVRGSARAEGDDPRG